MARLDFWFDYASTYSYLSAMRIEALAEAAGVQVHWRPFLLGPVFAASGWDTSPFNIYPAKGENMWRDMERLSMRYGLPPLRRSEVFPQHSVLAARIGLVGAREGWAGAFTKAVFTHQFTRAGRIDDAYALEKILKDLDLDPQWVLSEALDEANKARLRQETERAAGLGIFGAPTFVTGGGELFWGNARLEQALEWAAAEG
ncbi:MAG: 2-hydroxychromene-2-carboxylate isomerase [Flavobacteriaceae bacterium]